MHHWYVHLKGNDRPYHVPESSEPKIDVDTGVVTFNDAQGLVTAMFPLAAVAAIMRSETT